MSDAPRPVKVVPDGSRGWFHGWARDAAGDLMAVVESEYGHVGHRHPCYVRFLDGRKVPKQPSEW